VDGCGFMLQLLMFNAIYSQVDTIGDWSRGAMTIFIGTFSLLNAINMMIYFFGVNGIPGKIRSGDLDHYLTKPVNPLLRLSFENFDLSGALLIVMSILIVVYGVGIEGVTLDAGTVALYVVLILLMALLYYDMEIIVRTVGFFTLTTDMLNQFEGMMFSLCMKLPGTLFKGIWKIIFWLVLPYGIMATIPTQILIGMATPLAALYAALLTVAFTAFTLWFWKFGLRHYKSASS